MLLQRLDAIRFTGVWNAEEVESVLMLFPGLYEILPDFLIAVAESFVVGISDFPTRRCECAVGVEREKRPVHTTSVHVLEQMLHVRAGQVEAPRKHMSFAIYKHNWFLLSLARMNY